MTQKAQNILNQMKEKDRWRRILPRLNDPKHRSLTTESINRLDQDDTSRVGSNDQEMKVLTEMNALQDFENDNWSRND